MFYFITKRQDVLTSSIELAEVKRLKIFDELNQHAIIVTLEYNYDHAEVEKKLHIGGRVINLFQYFQNLNYNYDGTFNSKLINDIVNKPGYIVKNNIAFKDGKKRIHVILRGKHLYSASYYDHFGFLDHTDYYDAGCLSHTDFYEDKGRKVVTQYYNNLGKPVLTYYYRGGENNYPVLTMIKLDYQNTTVLFDSLSELYAYFLDKIVEKDSKAVFINDRSEVTLDAFKLMKNKYIPKYQIFHSALTVTGRLDSDLFEVYKPVKKMLEDKILSGVISSTKNEAMDAAELFSTKHSYAIPVTYLDEKTLETKFPFKNRIPGKLISVARLASVKRLDHIIKTVAYLHEEFPFISLDIYGYEDSENNNATPNYLRQLAKDKRAESYIHFCGYKDDLADVYKTADLEILTSQFEGFAMAVLEAQGYGCPVVSYDIDYGPSEIVSDGKSGRLIPPASTAALYKVIKGLLDDRKKLKYFSENAQASVKKYSFNNIKDKWYKFLKDENLLNR